MRRGLNQAWRIIELRLTERKTAVDVALSALIALGTRYRSPTDAPPPTSPTACVALDTHYPDAQRIRVVLENLPTHAAGGLL